MEIDREYSVSLDDSTATLLEEGYIVEELKTSIEGKRRRDLPLLPSCCIFKVPQLIRREKEESYVPDVVSIGPYHRSRGKFELTENVKRWYLDCFLSRTDALVELESLINGIMKFEKHARDCYAEPLDHLNQKDFLQMLILDGCFLIKLFQKCYRDHLVENSDSPVDPLFKMVCMMLYIHHDLLLLENQLPWFVLQFLYDELTVKTDKRSPSLIELVLNFFGIFDPIIDRAHEEVLHLDLPGEVLHILDLLRSVIVEKFEDPESKKKDNGKDQQRQETEKYIRRQKLQRIPNAKSLLEANVDFKSVNTTKCILNIEFKNGVLSIPTLAISRSTLPLFRNLIAFEKCYHTSSQMITSYTVLMDSLIDTSEDINILCQKGILTNWLSPEEASKFFNNLNSNTVLDRFHYRGLYRDVHIHYNTNWNKWMAKLRHDYFSTPWAVISLIAAFIILAFTLVQTAFTIHPQPR